MPVLFATVLFVNALLLFWVQPLFAKMVLPLLGGAPSVWTTCMLFFQAALLVGYAYSHVGLRWLGVQRQALIHCVIVWLPLLVLPIQVTQVGAASMAREPISSLLLLMVTTVGAPFLVLASTAPLLQRWFSSAARGMSDPYWLYAASNAGSLAALLAFPTLFEPLIPAREQAVLWKIAYALVAGLLTACGLLVVRRHAPAMASHHAVESAARAQPPSARTRLRWLALSFAPSTLMLGVTTYLSTDVAPVPLLWILPLSCYLLTFIVAFGWYSDTVRTATRRSLPWVLMPLVVLVLVALPVPIWIAIPIHIMAFSALALLCHGELARDRPSVQYLTEFYLWVAAGGVLGGVFNTLVAPQIFTSVAEYPLAIGATCLLCVSHEQFVEAVRNPRRMVRPALATGMAAALLVGERIALVPTVPMIGLLGVPVLMCVSVAKDAARFSLGIVGLLVALILGNAVGASGGGRILHADRTFFGVYRVRTDATGRLVSLMHGTTTHGTQVMGDTNPEPATYYHRQSPVAQVFKIRGADARSVGVIGLGAGTLAAYVGPNASWTFYEIDAAVETIARDTRFFHYLSRCGGQCSVLIGDARLSLAQRDVVHDLLILDAFSSDAIPLHLLTTEALQTYESRLAPDGLLVFHISNRHIRLRPVIARLARDRGLTAFARFDAAQDTTRGYQASEWVVMARRPSALESLDHDSRWNRLEADGKRAWTDDFSNIWTELR